MKNQCISNLNDRWGQVFHYGTSTALGKRIAYRGLDCSKCKIFIVTRNNDYEALARIAKE